MLKLVYNLFSKLLYKFVNLYFLTLYRGFTHEKNTNHTKQTHWRRAY